MARLRKKVDSDGADSTDSHGARRRLRAARGRAMNVPWSGASIRVRLTGWYAVVLTLMLVVYATATFVAVRQEFHEQLDDQLHDDFESAEGFPDAGAGGPRGVVRGSASRSRQRRGPGQRRVVAERRPDRPLRRVGGTAARCAGHRRRPAALRIDCRRRPALADLVGTTLVSGRSVVLRVARSEERLREQLSEVLEVLVLGLPLVDRPGGPRWICPRTSRAGADRSSCRRSPARDRGAPARTHLGSESSTTRSDAWRR